MAAAKKVELAIVCWFVGVFLSLASSVLVAWGLNAWQVYRHGVGIGLISIVIVFWGIVVGVFVVGPVVAVLAIKRVNRLRLDPAKPIEAATPVDAGGTHKTEGRSLGRLLVLGIGATALVAVGALGLCSAFGLGPCRGFPPHETVMRGGFRYVLPSPDGSQYALAYLTSFGTVERGDATAGFISNEEPGISSKDVAWMPDSKRVVVVFHEGAAEATGGDRIGIFSIESESMEQSFELPFQAADYGGIAVSADGGSALVTSDSQIRPGEQSFSRDLYRVDLRNGEAERIDVRFQGWPESPMYVDPRHAVVVDYRYGHGSLSLIDLQSGSITVLTPSELNVYDVVGRSARGGVVFSAFHGTSDPYVTTGVEFDDPVVALVDIESREVRELFEPGVLSALRMLPDGFHAIGLANTCAGDCSGADVWTLDLSRYLD